MFKKIMTPVDLLNLESIGKSLKCTSEIAKLYGANVTFVGVTGSAPSELARDQDAYQKQLNAFVKSQIREHGITATGKVQHCNDLVTDIDDALLAAISDIGADLVVMQSHTPRLSDYVWPSNGGKVANHSLATVMIVRD